MNINIGNEAKNLISAEPPCELARRKMIEDGYFVFEGALSATDVEAARSHCVDQWNVFVASGGLWFGGGTILGHLNYKPGKDLDLLGAVFADGAVLKVIRAILGETAVLRAIGGNVNLPGSGFQPIHVDGDWRTDYVVVNVPLGQVDEGNGSLELSPGSHKRTVSLREFKNSSAGSRRLRVNTRSGDVFIRHPNVWHRGTPNHSKEPRFMLSFAFGPALEDRENLPGEVQTALDLVVAEIHLQLGTGEFSPNYFGRNIRGYLKEGTCRYLPQLFEWIRMRNGYKPPSDLAVVDEH